MEVNSSCWEKQNRTRKVLSTSLTNKGFLARVQIQP